MTAQNVLLKHVVEYHALVVISVVPAAIEIGSRGGTIVTELTSDLRVPAAQYVRMSTEHQRYSLENQAAAIAEYAAQRGYAIVQTYADAGKSGLSLKGRDGLQQLLADVVTGQHSYSAILVLDVSRWGRFQDSDQSAHYEFICRDAGVAVEYCGEPFENDGSMVSMIVKNLKRVMAGEYSRELSTKVSRAQTQQARLGFRQGGGVLYGIRRLLVSEDGEHRFLLGPGEQKGLSTDRVVFVPGPPDEITTVRRIFRMFVSQHLTTTVIARKLNVEGVPATNGQAWTQTRVRTLLTSELMVGYYVYNVRTRRMKGPSRPNPPDLWIRTRVMDPIVDTKRFAKVQQEMRRKVGNAYAKTDMIDRLRRLFREKGKLSQGIIDACSYTASSSSYVNHFGSLVASYELVGYKCLWQQGLRYTDDYLIDGIRRLHAEFGYVTAKMINADPDLPVARVFTFRFGSLIRAYALAGFPSTVYESVRAGMKRATAQPHSKFKWGFTNDQLLDGLRRLHANFGYITSSLINSDPDLPAAGVFRSRFGSILQAYALAGFPTTRSESRSAARKRARELLEAAERQSKRK
ncbi:recombinase family protein [Mesorhizobium sp. BR1-1-4]|uniref:recombinase family protein n=1 Tax=Mesorhizobium sp. BR1-1-4 TaxID=2876650 RepID=UPI001CCE9102|nr:recombinase family protein [Mesorhizobium sp. BR1-1-4]MBZ9925014.1 recombinase family protein [Mesorhizobium sp. BR1-1-4]